MAGLSAAFSSAVPNNHLGPMTIPSHNLLMAAVDTLQLIENRDGYHASRQASDLLDALFSRQLAELNATAERMTRNDLKHSLRMLIRRDARLAGVQLPCLNG
jgi:hypothetical protein